MSLLAKYAKSNNRTMASLIRPVWFCYSTKLEGHLSKKRLKEIRRIECMRYFYMMRMMKTILEYS